MTTLSQQEHRRDLYLRRTFGITLVEYRNIIRAQRGLCYVCEKKLVGISHPVDHDHASGLIRGVLCTYCNRRRIGQHRDWKIVQRMADYLRHPPAEKVIGHRAVPKQKPKPRKKKSVS